MVAFYLTKMVSTLLLISSQTKKKLILKSYCHCLDALKKPDATVVLRSPSGDTDIMVLAVSLISSSQDRVLIDYRDGKNRKAIKSSNVNMATDLKQALVRFQSFTENDYVSSFITKGKTASWKKIVKDERISGVWYVLGNYARNI